MSGFSSEGPGEPREPALAARRDPQRFRVIAVTSSKGGVGKSTIAMNLAICARALREDVPILVMSFDDQFFLEHMFALEANPQKPTIVDVMREGDLGPAIRLGQHGVGYVPSSLKVGEYRRELKNPFELRRILERSGWQGLVVIDTKSNLEILTQNAIAASDLAVVVVTDSASLAEAEKVYALLDAWERPREHAQILLSLIDLRVKYCESEHRDGLALLLSEIRQRGYPLLESVVSRSPKIESPYTNPEGGARSVLHAAREWLLKRQLQQLTCELLESLDRLPALPGLPSEATLSRFARPAGPGPASGERDLAWERRLFSVDELLSEESAPDPGEEEAEAAPSRRAGGAPYKVPPPGSDADSATSSAGATGREYLEVLRARGPHRSGNPGGR